MARTQTFLMLFGLLPACFDFSAPSDLPNGARSEGNGSACNSGHSVDGVCCDEPCDAPCTACLASETGLANGVCGFVSVARDPRENCPGDLACDGAGGCLTGASVGCATAEQCQTGFCTDGVCCDQLCSGACVSCLNALTGAPDGECAATLVGLEENDECSGPLVCNGSGACYDTHNGEPCSVGFECASGACSDGVCCDRGCDGVCEGCTQVGAVGTCSIYAADTDPDEECPEAMCDGTGKCDATTPDTPCVADEDCGDGVCCSGVCRSGWTALDIPLNAESSEAAFKALGLPGGVAVVGTNEGRLLKYDGAWLDISPPEVALSAIRGLDGTSSDNLVAIDFDGHIMRLRNGVWTDLARSGEWPVAVFVVDGNSFYVTTYSGNMFYHAIHRWQDGYTTVSQPSAQNAWYRLWRIGANVYVGGGEYFFPGPPVREWFCKTPHIGRIVNGVLELLVDPPACIEQSSTGRYGGVVISGSAPGIWTVNAEGQTSPVHTEDPGDVASAGSRPNIFISRGINGFGWNSGEGWRTATVPGNARSVSATGACDAFGVTDFEAYKF